MACRCEDIKKMKNDRKILQDMFFPANALPNINDSVTENLTKVSVSSKACFYTKSGFDSKVLQLKGNADSDITVLTTKIDSLYEQLENELSSAKAEDHKYHWEEFWSHFKLG